tara:strand:- start:221 stop:457 length:237 start_codon:yes stop_codon:yes gene_type:complete
MTRYHNINGKLIAFTAEEETARDAEEAASVVEKAATEYIRSREAEYPSVVDQLDQMYHFGFQAWKDEIQKIKEKYPKP